MIINCGEEQRMMIFCTLFNSGYLDKGIVMFQSLQKVTNDFKLYVVSFDDKCFEVLQRYRSDQLIPISLEEFEVLLDMFLSRY